MSAWRQWLPSPTAWLAGLRARFFERFAAMLGDPPPAGQARALFDEVLFHGVQLLQASDFCARTTAAAIWL